MINYFMHREEQFAEILQTVRGSPDSFDQSMISNIVLSDSGIITHGYEVIAEYIEKWNGTHLPKPNLEKIDVDFFYTLSSWRYTHQKYLTQFQDYDALAFRQDWWQEKSTEAQIVSDIGKIYHDLSIMLDIVDQGNTKLTEFEEQVSSIVTAISYDRKYVKIYTTGNVLNIQAKTGHSVKIFSSGRIYGEIGSHSPITNLSGRIKSMDYMTLKRVITLVAWLVGNEQRMRSDVMDLHTRVESMMEYINRLIHEGKRNMERKSEQDAGTEVESTNWQLLEKFIQDPDQYIMEALKIPGIGADLRLIAKRYMKVKDMWLESVNLAQELQQYIEHYHGSLIWISRTDLIPGFPSHEKILAALDKVIETLQRRH